MKKTLRYLTLCALLPATPIQAGDFKVLQLEYIMPHEYPWVNVITTEADWGNF
ncbi:MAG: hypothetical protein N0E55_05060 [Candidatus Thiodiazotropha taylori]|nr:hypothetical protein [Candidatus Thiodiazotropha taylori]MCG8108195.1 hypothetical protein [Candidatus Thiodiazotropha taylori]MCG8123322.1 hypothetical protein [Candidatus Thiodiazotropha taylori]MCW4252059.1 hypothetical protein [Candidatus Thiodiazotropha taylori]MCW4280533.1 hypothetical protein [Candidatus Thiodiazotropha taylori]